MVIDDNQPTKTLLINQSGNHMRETTTSMSERSSSNSQHHKELLSIRSLSNEFPKGLNYQSSQNLDKYNENMFNSSQSSNNWNSQSIEYTEVPQHH